MRYFKLDIFRQKHNINWQWPFILWNGNHRKRPKENCFCVTDSPFTSNSFHFIYFVWDLLWKIALFSEASVLDCWGEMDYCFMHFLLLFFHPKWVWCQMSNFSSIYGTNLVTMTLFSPPPSSQRVSSSSK